MAMSCSMALRRSPKPGALTATDLKVPRTLLTMSVARGLALDVLGDDHQRLARLHDLLQHREQVLHRRDLAVDDEEVRVLQHRLHALGVGDEVRRDVALVEAHALGELELEAEGVALLDGDDAFLADLVHRLSDDLADARVGRGDRRGGRDLLLGLHVLGEVGELLRHGATAASMPRFRAIGFAPAATLRRPSRTSAWARTVAVVVPSPATSSVFFATSLTSSAPIFSYGSSSSISLAMLTPSLVMVGAPHFFSRTTLRPLGPSVTLTAVGEDVHAPLETAARLLVERDNLGHSALSSWTVCTHLRITVAVNDRDRRSGRISPRRPAPLGAPPPRPEAPRRGPEPALAVGECQHLFSTLPFECKRSIRGGATLITGFTQAA
jgi:hypothetical protein